MFRSAQLQILGIILILVGGFQLLSGLSYADVARREATTVGTISRVDCGRTCTFVYVFKINGVGIQDDTNTCRTSLSPQRCRVGAPVLVYYDPENVSQTLLQDFRAASRGRIFFGIWMVSCGLLLMGLRLILDKREKNSSEIEQRENPGEDEVLHVAPGE